MDKKETFIAAIKKNEGCILKIAAVYTNSMADRNDLVQEIIYQLWKSYDSFNQTASLSTWMYRVALNVAIYQLKTTKKRVLTIPLENELLNHSDSETDVGDEQWHLLKKQIEQLNLMDRGIVILYLEDKSYDEIGAIIGISTSNVGTKLSRIKEKLRTQISKL